MSHYLTGASAVGANYFQIIPYPAELTNVQCNGTENSLLNCVYSTAANCSSAIDAAGVSCSGSLGECEMAGFLGCCEENCTIGSCTCNDGCLLDDSLRCCSDTSVVCPTPGKESIDDLIVIQYT